MNESETTNYSITTISCYEITLRMHKLFYVTNIAFNPSAWGHLTLQRGVTGTARMLHALTHSSISRQVREQM